MDALTAYRAFCDDCEREYVAGNPIMSAYDRVYGAWSLAISIGVPLTDDDRPFQWRRRVEGRAA